MKDSCFQQPLLLLANNSFNFKLRAITLKVCYMLHPFVSKRSSTTNEIKNTKSVLLVLCKNCISSQCTNMHVFSTDCGALQYLGSISYQSENMHLDRLAVLEARFSIARKKPITQVPTSIVPKWPKMPVKTRRVKQLLRYYQSWYFQRLNRPEY